jgi:dihydroorotate dehydrogenase electron transfer subunit
LDAPNHFVMTFHAPELAREALPGQFIAVAAGGGMQILRRPFSVYSVDPEAGWASILYSVYGPATSTMAKMKPGDELDFIGPLGGRVFEADPDPSCHHIMVGGGYGVPPLAFLSRNIRAANPNARITVISGGRTKNLLVGTDGLEEIGVTLEPCTNDGSCGYHGLVTGRLEEVLAEDQTAHQPSYVYTCGPTPMMKAVGDLSIEKGVPCQVSMEVFMPCGVGICMGCAVARHDGTYARGCTDGPVFPAREVKW